MFLLATPTLFFSSLNLAGWWEGKKRTKTLNNHKALYIFTFIFIPDSWQGEIKPLKKKISGKAFRNLKFKLTPSFFKVSVLIKTITKWDGLGIGVKSILKSLKM